NAHGWSLPSAMATTPLVMPGTSIAVSESVWVPLPSWPASLLPQHLTPPARVSAHVCNWPLAIAVAVPPGGGVVGSGVGAGVAGVAAGDGVADGPARTALADGNGAEAAGTGAGDVLTDRTTMRPATTR